MMERGKKGRWASRIIGLVVLLVFFLLMKLMATQLERMVQVDGGDAPERRSSKPTRDGDVPEGAVW